MEERTMLVNKAIAKLMRDNNLTQLEMAKMIGKTKATDISARLNYPNMSIKTVIEMLSVLGHDLVIQPKAFLSDKQILVEVETNNKTNGGEKICIEN
jgi:hypothetical protein